MEHAARPGARATRRSLAAIFVFAGVALACSAPAPGSAPGSATGPAPDQAPAGANGDATSTSAPDTTVPAGPDRPAPPGSLISATPIGAPPGARAWHLVYHSSDLAGRDIAVTGTLLAPADAGPDTPLVTWAHPTTGSADACAPSRFGARDLPLPELLTSRGWAVVATDYEGLGTGDPHPYLVGASEAHGVLDAARAARQVPETGVSGASPVTIWGFSQGGHAAAFAGQLAPAYAPELRLVGDVIAAPVSDVDHFAARAEGIDDQFGVIVTIVGGYARAYPELDPGVVFQPEVVAQLGELERRCIGEVNAFFTRPVASMLRVRPTRDRAFSGRFAQNRAGDAPIAVPVLVVQGALDDIVDPADTQAMVARYCASGVTVDYVVKPAAHHGVISDDPYVAWLADRFAGRPAPSTCAATP